MTLKSTLITADPQNIIFDSTNDDIRIIVFHNSSGGYTVRTTGIIDGDEYLFSILKCPTLELAMKNTK